MDFYPRPPRGGRRQHSDRQHRSTGFLSTPSARRATKEQSTSHKQHQFLSTPSARRATLAQPTSRHLTRISIHALREEGDILLAQTRSGKSYFYPRPPRGGRLVVVVVGDVEMLFLSTPSARRATEIDKNQRRTKIFLSTPSARRATASRDVQARHLVISIHALREEGDQASGLSH